MGWSFIRFEFRDFEYNKQKDKDKRVKENKMGEAEPYPD